MTEMKKNKKKNPIDTAYEIYKKHSITVNGYSGMPSVAARHTAIELGDYIQLDCGNLPREIAMKKKLVLITHFHSDHGADICNCVGYDNRVTIFTPAYCAEQLFYKIKYDISLRKGRMYEDDEIVKMVRIVGCKRPNSNNNEFKDGTCIKSCNLVIAELVEMGTKVLVVIDKNKEVMVEPFQCFHTVETCGYVIYNVQKKLSDSLEFKKGSVISVNFTEDQPLKTVKSSKANQIDAINMAETKIEIYDWKKEEKYKDIIMFNERHKTNIIPKIVDKVVSPKYTLKVRQLTFEDDIKIKTMDENGKCMLDSSDFEFFKKYKIDFNKDQLTAKTMFFGDTCSYVFNKNNKHVYDLLSIVENVIIESTYMELSQKNMSAKKLKARMENRHMFLYELMPIFNGYPNIKFTLIHFSACYDKNMINECMKEVNKKYKNVSAFI